ncbi:MAG: acetylserotonin O-methyltransferase [Nitrososphaerales archaeon]|nr:acetylserotonin O-methyltransferase [Nitrososphaerales archaeon]
MPVKLNLLERLAILRWNWTNGTFLDLLSSGAFRAACAAVNLGIFEALGIDALSSFDVATKAKTDPRATELLLEALCGFGYMEKESGRYRNSELAKKWLLEKSPTAQPATTSFYHDILFELWDSQLEEAIRNGRPSLNFEKWLERDPQRWRLYMKFSMEIARWEAPLVVERVKLQTGARTMLDLGGGHGLFSIAFCKKYPGLSATILDRPGSLDFARETVVKEGAEKQVSFQEGDFIAGNIGQGYDFVLAFGFLHQYLQTDILGLFGKVWQAINPGGLLVIKDEFRDESSWPSRRAWNKFQGLNYFTLFGGRTHSFLEVKEWLEKTGFTDVRFIQLPRTVSRLVTAKKVETRS